ncbi:MAG: hypothetical protein ACE15F_11210 [bacterium]
MLDDDRALVDWFIRPSTSSSFSLPRLDDDQALVDWCRAGGGLVRGIAVRRGDEWIWSDEFQDSPVHQAVPVEGLSAVIEGALGYGG